MRYIKQAVFETPKMSLDISKDILAIDKRLNAVNTILNGDRTLSRREFETLPSLNGRINNITSGLWATTAAPTQTQYKSYELAARQFAPLLNELRSIGAEVRKLEEKLEKAGAPYTPGRVPNVYDGN
jgi:sulfite reductase alpha subunit-like flavoprotein